jgi:hypothetical protein
MAMLCTAFFLRTVPNGFQSCTRLLSSSFQPPDPPGTSWGRIFPDIDFSVPSAESKQRNQDLNAVFVVAGASRGIGLQFVKELMDRTQVCFFLTKSL